MKKNWRSDGTLSADDFVISAIDLIEKWKQIDSAKNLWSLNSSRIGDVYLSLVENIYCSGENNPNFSHHFQNKDEELTWHHHSSEEINIEEDEVYDDVDNDTEDIAALVLDGNNDIHTYDFHIIYSHSYEVPVLYFRGCKHDGQPLDSRSVERDLPLYSSTIMKESKWTYVTQEEHPFLHRSWYMLHPCGTSEWMKLLLLAGSKESDDTPRNEQPLSESELSEVKRYLPSWLSVVGQVVGLKIPFEIQKKSDTHTS